MVSIDGYAYASRLRSWHPAEKASLALATMGVALATSSPRIEVTIAGLMLVMTVGLAGIPPGFYLRLLALPAAFLLVGAVTAGLTTAGPGTGQGADFLVAASLGNITAGFTVAGLHLATTLLLRSLAAVTCLYFLALTTPMVDVIWLLRRLRVPALLAELLELTYRYIFVLADLAAQVYTAQSCRQGYTSWGNSCRSLGQLVNAVFRKATWYSRQLAVALAARGYQGQLAVMEDEYFWLPVRAALLACLEIGLVALAWLDRGYYLG